MRMQGRVARLSRTSGAGAHAIDMCSTCIHVEHMSKMIQIRNVPDDLHRRLKSRAALAGMSLSDYLLNEIRQDRRAADLGGVPRPAGDALAG